MHYLKAVVLVNISIQIGFNYFYPFAQKFHRDNRILSFAEKVRNDLDVEFDLYQHVGEIKSTDKYATIREARKVEKQVLGRINKKMEELRKKKGFVKK